MYYYYDYSSPLYFALLAAMAFALFASWKVKHTYKKYQNYRCMSGITASQAARRILDSKGLRNVPVGQVPGTLTDYYDPRTNEVCLGSEEAWSSSPVAIGVACHECGHAMQHAENYFPAQLRSAAVSVSNIGSQLSWPLILAGFILSRMIPALWVLVYVGIAAFSLSTIFQLITLPVEFNASRRAMAAIRENCLLTDEECDMAKQVLSAAALTYVASLAVSLTQLLRMIAIYGGRRNRR